MANFNALLACINANAGSGLYSQILSDTPTIASTGLANWLNQGSSTVSDSGVGMTISAPSSGSSDNLRSQVQSCSDSALHNHGFGFDDTQFDQP